MMGGNCISFAGCCCQQSKVLEREPLRRGRRGRGLNIMRGMNKERREVGSVVYEETGRSSG